MFPLAIYIILDLINIGLLIEIENSYIYYVQIKHYKTLKKFM